MLPTGQPAGKGRTQDRRKPEQPELRNISTARKQRRSGAPRRVYRGVRDRNEEKVNERQTETDGYAGKSHSRALGCGAYDHVQKEKRGDGFGQETRYQTVFARAEIAIAIGGKSAGRPAR